MAFQALTIIVALLIGWIRRGSLWSIGRLKVRVWWILPIAYVLQHISVFYLTGTAYRLVIVLSYIVMLGFCTLNLRLPGVWWALVGTGANFVALLVNGLRMPAYMPTVRVMAPQIIPMLKAGTYGKSIAMSSTTHLNFLGDIFGFNVRPASLLSIGDILFSIGLVIIIQYAMRIKDEGRVDGTVLGKP